MAKVPPSDIKPPSGALVPPTPPPSALPVVSFFHRLPHHQDHRPRYLLQGRGRPVISGGAATSVSKEADKAKQPTPKSDGPWADMPSVIDDVAPKAKTLVVNKAGRPIKRHTCGDNHFDRDCPQKLKDVLCYEYQQWSFCRKLCE